MLNIVIPMAGAGSRFAKAGYADPKPLIPVGKFRMIQLVIRNLTPEQDHRFIFVCQKSHVLQYNLAPQLRNWAPNCEIIEIDGLTEGAACTVLEARRFIDNADPLMIANSDQYIDYDINAYLARIEKYGLDGLIMTMTANDPKWSYVSLSQEGLVTNVVEKQVISSHATVGIYNFTKGEDFVAAADAMIKSNNRTNGEFYVAPTYNELVAKGLRIGICDIGTEANGMYGLGIPSDLNLFKSLPIFSKACGD